MTQSSCKRDTKSKSHPSVKLAPVRVFSCKHPLSAGVNYIHAFRVALYTIFQRFEYHMCITIFLRWQMLGNHVALG